MEKTRTSNVQLPTLNVEPRRKGSWDPTAETRRPQRIKGGREEEPTAGYRTLLYPTVAYRRGTTGTTDHRMGRLTPGVRSGEVPQAGWQFFWLLSVTMGYYGLPVGYRRLL
jgi:hypothetical protein